MYFCLQAIKQSATELLFGGHETTASTATSLVMFLGLHPKVVHKLRQELEDKVKLVYSDCFSLFCKNKVWTFIPIYHLVLSFVTKSM